MPTASKPQLDAAKPAPETMVCTRFCRSRERKDFIQAKGMRASAMAMTAPRIDVFAGMPTLAMSCIQIMAEKTETITLKKSVCGSSALTFSLTYTVITPSSCDTPPQGTAPSQPTSYEDRATMAAPMILSNRRYSSKIRYSSG